MANFTAKLGLVVLTALGSIPRIVTAQDLLPEDYDAAAAKAAQKVSYTTFKLYPIGKVENCLRDYSGYPPSATVVVARGPLNDHLIVLGNHIKPGLQFDLFTVEKTPLLSNGSPSPTFDGTFGMAWYQSDLQADRYGRASAQIQTILLDQIFGFDANANLPPTNTFHVGFWFNNPKDAQACGFDVTKPTPFNGEHKAGPLAMISVPNSRSGLGPLCTDPDPSHPGHCNP
jgi:hypothetical protein